MNEDELRRKLKDLKLDDKSIDDLSPVIAMVASATEKNLRNLDGFDAQTYRLAIDTHNVPRRKSLRLIAHDMTLLALDQLEPYGILSIGVKRYRLLMRLILSQPFKEGSPIIEAKEAELRSVCDSTIENLRAEGLVKVESGALWLTTGDGRKRSTRLRNSFNIFHHKMLEDIIDRMDFWIVAILERENKIEEYFDRSTSALRERLTGYFAEDEQSLYKKLELEIWDLVKEYRQRIPSHRPATPPSLMRGASNSSTRIDNDIQNIALFSDPVGRGITRLPFTTFEDDALVWAAQRLGEANYEYNSDPFGNLHAYDRREGNCRILVGSHLDSVPNGGKYDGVVGLVTFLETLRLIGEEKRTFPLPVDVVIFRAEESSVFKRALLGSSVAVGRFDIKDLKNIRVDRDQELKNLLPYYPNVERDNLKWASLFDVLSGRTDAFPSEIKKGCWFFDYPKESYVCYIEVHIEQGAVLEMERKNFGLVTGFRASYREVVTIEGEANHSGTTPMGGRYRRDAGCAMDECCLAAEKICEEESAKGLDIVGTNGSQSTPGGAINVIPGRADFTLDLRSNNLEHRSRVLQRIHNEWTAICRRRSVIFRAEERENSEPVSLDDPRSKMLRNRSKKAIHKLGYSYMEIASGASHDAMSLARVGVPTCMLFIPCEKGISHSPDEKAEADDIAKASRVLLEFLCDFAPQPKKPADAKLESFMAI